MLKLTQAPGEDEMIEDFKVHKDIFPWQVVPELTKMDKKITYQEIFKGMTPLMRSTMVFYNHFAETDEHSLTAVVALPFTPSMLNYFTPE